MERRSAIRRTISLIALAALTTGGAVGAWAFLRGEDPVPIEAGGPSRPVITKKRPAVEIGRGSAPEPTVATRPGAAPDAEALPPVIRGEFTALVGGDDSNPYAGASFRLAPARNPADARPSLKGVSSTLAAAPANNNTFSGISSGQGGGGGGGSGSGRGGVAGPGSGTSPSSASYGHASGLVANGIAPSSPAAGTSPAFESVGTSGPGTASSSPSNPSPSPIIVAATSLPGSPLGPIGVVAGPTGGYGGPSGVARPPTFGGPISSGGAGGGGVVTPGGIVPEPASVVMAGTAIATGLAYAWRRRRRAAVAG